MSDATDTVTIHETARALDIGISTAVVWARTGKLVGSVKDTAGSWLIQRSEITRILDEREASAERRIARWQPMTNRTTPSGYGPAERDCPPEVGDSSYPHMFGVGEAELTT